MPMRIRLRGGPCDGQDFVVEDYLSEFRVAQFNGIGSQATEIVYRKIRGWTIDGIRYFVAPDFRRSLIGDEEIEVAARWLADQTAEDMSESWGNARQMLRDDALRGWRADFKRLRDNYTGEPDLKLGGVSGPLGHTVRIRPGRVVGWREEDHAKPSFVWPPPRLTPRLAKEDIAGGQLFGEAIERALEREIRWKDEEQEKAGSSPVPPKGESAGESSPSGGSWRDNPAML